MAEEVAADLAAEAVVGCVNQVKHHFRYLSQYEENMTNLEANVRNLEDKKVSVRDDVFIANSNAQTIKEGVNTWLGKVKDMKEDADNILEKKTSAGSGCWKGWCVNIRPRYRLNKKAMKKNADLVTFIKQGVFDAVANPKRHLGLVTSQIERTTDENIIRGDEISENSNATKERLESRTMLLNDVMEAVRDPEIRMVRICGMGGIGKTTMAKQVQEMAKIEHLFNDIAMVTVNQNPELTPLQDDIAEWLGLTIPEHSELPRAMRLRERLSGPKYEVLNKKILVILDNVWENINFEKVGIPLQDTSSCCKILLTSRNDSICEGLVHEKKFRVEVLSDSEPLRLFCQSISDESYYKKTISQDLVKECGGLPIAVAAIAGAINNKPKREWARVLNNLQKSGIREGYDAVSACLKISYDFLENEKIKKFFRLRDNEGCESVFVDIVSISTLVVLDVKIPEDQAKRMNSLFKKLKKFKIFVNAEETTAEDEDPSENRLDIHCDLSILLQPGLASLLQKASRMELRITQLANLQLLNDSETLSFRIGEFEA